MSNIPCRVRTDESRRKDSREKWSEFDRGEGANSNKKWELMGGARP